MLTLCLSTLSWASGNSTSGNSNNNSSESNASLNPNVEQKPPVVRTEPADQHMLNSGGSKIPEGGVGELVQPDSSEINSLNKFNFIFYFIYKLKYDDASTLNSEYLF